MMRNDDPSTVIGYDHITRNTNGHNGNGHNGNGHNGNGNGHNGNGHNGNGNGHNGNGHNGNGNGHNGSGNGHNGSGNGHNGSGNGVIPVSRCRHNYHERTEQAINRQINLFMHAGYVYSSMVSSVAMVGE